MKKDTFSIRKRLASFKYAFSGIWTLLKGEHNAWIHTLAAVLVITAGFFVRLTNNEWAIIVVVIGSVLAAEAFNTAIEKLADILSPQYNKDIKVVKDLAAGGVLFTTIAAVIVGLILFLPKLLPSV